jgi:hypothetical protein
MGVKKIDVEKVARAIEADADAMEAHEIEIMRKLGFKNPY